ncbi:uncharacterized protein PG986_009656 [Apiospora aurea]|uniref:Uncharacterized protein n=1 Tax=Apiospora aurea TaxID=335848 RepID=A0ABR1Q8B4_9PEZI
MLSIVDLSQTPNLQKMGDGQLKYIDPSHWLSILDDINEGWCTLPNFKPSTQHSGSHLRQQRPDFGPSRRAYVQAVLEMLARPAEVHQACEPGAWLYEDRWIFAALPVHDFLLAVMVVCLDVSVRMRSNSQERASSETEYRELASKEFRALFDSQRIWVASSAAFPEANVAALALDLMVQKMAETDTELFLGLHSMIGGSEIIDWRLLDQYFQNMDPSTLDATF